MENIPKPLDISKKIKKKHPHIFTTKIVAKTGTYKRDSHILSILTS